MGLNLKGLMVLSFMATSGVTLLVLGCALSSYNWWPIFVVIFYILSPIPTIISRRCVTDSFMGDPYTGRCVEFSAFLTSIIIVSAYALPAVMAHTPENDPLIKWSSAGFIFGGNTIIFATIFIFVRLVLVEDNYGGW